MRILVTGATSMVGVALVEAALQDHDLEKLYAVVRPDTTKWDRLSHDKRIVRVDCDLANYDELSHLINESCDCFYHLAWTRTSTYEESTEDMLGKCDCIKGVILAVEAANRLGCQKFVWAGGQSEYGLAGDKLGPESPCDPVRADGITHYAAGKMGRLIAEKCGMKFIWMRIFSIYGKYDRGNSMIASTIKKLKNHEHCSFTPAEQLWDYLNAADAGRAFYMAGTRAKESNIYCVGSGKMRPLREYIEIIRDVVAPGREIGIGELPYPSNPVMTLCADIESLTRDTGWKPEIRFEDGIRTLAKEG